MNRWITFFGLCLVASQASAQAELREELQARYDKLTRLTVRLREKEVLEQTRKWLTSDYTYQEKSGTEISAEAFFAYSSNQLEKIGKYNSYTNKIVSMRTEGVSVVLKVKSTFDLLQRGFDAPRIVGSSVTEDYWVRTINGWKMKRTVTLQEGAKLIPAKGAKL